jgi:prephenate dehydratase
MTRTPGEEFLDLSFPDGSTVSVITTLGPAGTSSETAVDRLMTRLTRDGGEPARTVLHPTYESAAGAVVDGAADLLVVANAYAHIDAFYMDPALRLVGAFHHQTPHYGIAVASEHTVPAAIRVASHPAPIPLINELLPDQHTVREVVPAASTSAAALAAVSSQVDAALTTLIAAELYGLTFISRTRPIEMLWSVFCAAARTTDVTEPQNAEDGPAAARQPLVTGELVGI